MEKLQRKKLNKTELAILKTIKKINRDLFKFEPVRITKNKKKYKRKKYRYKDDNS